MAKDNTKNKSTDKDISALDKVAKSILTLVDSGYSERTRLNSQNDRFQAIIDRELDLSKGVSQNSIVDFVMSLNTGGKQQNGKGKPAELTDTSSIFTRDIGDIFNYFQDVYKNRYIEMTDLKFISKFIPALGEAVKTTLDAIVASDDVTSTITRNIIFSSNASEEDKTQIMNEIIRFEKELKLLKKLKNVVYKKTLVTGKFYTYAISYKELFEEYSRNKANKVNKTAQYGSTHDVGFGLKRAHESANNISTDTSTILDLTAAIESVTTMVKNSSDGLKPIEIEELKKSMKSTLPIVTFSNESYLEAALEGAGVLFDNNFNGKAFTEIDINNILTSDGTKDINIKAEAFDVTGTYIKYIDSKNIVPIKVLDQIIGYYHIHVTSKKNSAGGTNGIVSSNSSIFSSVNMSEKKKEDAINTIVNTISDGILKKFNTKFVSENTEYKQMIADCIISHGLIDNDYAIQFIPVNHIVEFMVNEDENGNGESILADSLFPAKLLLSLIICKMLTYMNKSGNKTLAHVYKGQLDISSTNQLNRVVRMMQESNITFNDLLSTNMVFSKFTRDSNIALPTAKNGNKLIEMETMEGQQVDLKTDFEDKLEQMAILGTGVPSVILEYVNQVDFAKQIVSANIKFAGRASSLQSDLEEPSTILYRKILGNSALPPNVKSIAALISFKLPRPRVLSNANNSEFLQAIQSTANSIADTLMGQNQDNDKKLTKIKESIIKEVVVSNTPFLDWEKLEELYKKAMIDASKPEDPISNPETGI